MGATAPFVRAQTGLPLQVEERPWEGPKQERPPLTQSI